MKKPCKSFRGQWAMGKEKLHFEVPPSIQVSQEMNQFVKWHNAFNTKGSVSKTIIKTAITHLYFESIHPFEDGNGRIGRALIEKCLSESLDRHVIMSISQKSALETLDFSRKKAHFFDQKQIKNESYTNESD
ncbi:MAG: Fic family protein [Bacteroidales bacterium]